MTLGYADADGAGFFSVAGQPGVIPVQGGDNSQWLFGQFDNVQEFTVPAGKYLALRLANSHPFNAFHFFKGGAWSYVTASDPAPAYPVKSAARTINLLPVLQLLLLQN